MVEILQLVTSKGLCEFDDVIHNVVGTVVGIVVTMLINKLIMKTDRGTLMIVLWIILWIIIISTIVGIIAGVVDLLDKKSGHKPYGPYEQFVKRPLDAFLATGALIVLSPVLLVTAILVRTKLGSPVLFKQERPGRNGKIFKLYKFRSMTDERDENGVLLPDTVRLTPFGRTLRSTSLDELPELLNIIRGDMAVIGPRPLAVIYLPYYTKRERHRHDVRPGLTGWAQVNGRNSITWEDKFKYDLEYAEKISFVFDAKIIYLTIKKVFIKEGIGQGEYRPESLHILRKDWLDDNELVKPEFEED